MKRACPPRSGRKPASAVDCARTFVRARKSRLRSCDRRPRAPMQSLELGPIRRIRVAHARDVIVRSAGASGGVVTALLCDLLDRGKITGAIVLDSHPDAPWRPWPRIARTRAQVLPASQSKYCVTPTNVALNEIDPGTDRLAMVALPCQIHALRALECRGHTAMKGVSIIIGLYCGNQLYFGATRSFLRRHGVRDLSEVAEIRYRDGLWPGQVRCILKDGRSFAAPKFQFNHLISFYAVERCLLCADLAAEGADISVADAWDRPCQGVPTLGANQAVQGRSNKHCFCEATAHGDGRGSLLVVSRTELGESTVSDLAARGIIDAEEIELEQALAMHAHGLDLKKIGSLLRVQNLDKRGRPAPQYDLLQPNPSITRHMAEVLVSAHFRLLHTLRGPVDFRPDSFRPHRARICFREKGLAALRRNEDVQNLPSPFERGARGEGMDRSHVRDEPSP